MLADELYPPSLHGNSVGVVHISENLNENLPSKAKDTVIETNNGKRKILPLFDGSLNELNVPVYPEKRIFESVTRKICLLAPNKTGIELIVKKRPSIINGENKLIRIDCNQLGIY